MGDDPPRYYMHDTLADAQSEVRRLKIKLTKCRRELALEARKLQVEKTERVLDGATALEKADRIEAYEQAIEAAKLKWPGWQNTPGAHAIKFIEDHVTDNMKGATK